MRTGKPLAAGILVALELVLIVCGSGGSQGEVVPTVTIGDAAWKVDLAQTPAQRTKGLSGRESMPPRTGMLFVYPAATAPAFWMKGMLFPLDFVWIGEDCIVVEIASNVQPPAPGTPDSALPIYRSAEPAAYTLELNAGEAQGFGIQVGDEVRFSGLSADGGGCEG